MNLPGQPVPDFATPAFLRAHIADTMAFYHPRAIDPSGGFFHYFRDDGSVYDSAHRHLVSSTRFVYQYAMAAIEFSASPLAPEYRHAVAHGLRYLQEYHYDPAIGGYAWTLRDHAREDCTQHAYGVAFVLLAFATARKAGFDTIDAIENTWQLLERRFWDADAGLYRDEADSSWMFSDYRGQNANMHLCEALLAAFEASGDARYLDRALLLADHVTRRQAALAGGLVWEHYDHGWNVDWNYHRDDPKHLFRPWGFQPGHQIEWTKLLLQLDGHLGARGHAPQWLVSTAQHLFDVSIAHAWDETYGGVVYGFMSGTLDSPLMDGATIDVDSPTWCCDDDKYFWVQAEAIAASARLFARTGDARYRGWYECIWRYAWQHFIDHRHGGWYRILDRRNAKYSDEKSPAGKTDYHTMGACHDVLHVLADVSNSGMAK